MSALTILLYLIAFGLWWYLIRQEGGIGIGIRFLYALNVALFFLVGPMLEELFGPADRQFILFALEPAVCLSLYAFLAYLAGSYVVYPILIGRARLVPPNFVDRMAEPGRLDVQWKVAWGLIAIGFASLPLYWTIHAVPTLGAIGSQLPLLIDTGMVILCLNAAWARQFGGLAAVVLVWLTKGLLFSAMTGFAGSIFINGMFLACLTVLSARLRVVGIAAVAVLGVLALIPTKLWLSGRDQLRTAIGQERGIEERMGITINIFFNPESITGQELDLVSWYRQRGDYSHLLAAALAHTPAVQPYGMGESYLNVFIAVIPRILWPDKPFKAGGNEFVSQYTGIRFNDSTSVGMNYLFELYVNFGAPGVVVGMFLLGLLLAWMEAFYYRKAPRNLFYEYCLILCAWTVCVYSDKMADLAMTIPPIIATCLGVHMLLRPQIRSRYLPSLWNLSKSAIPMIRRA